MSLILQDSQLYDSVLCSEVADTNWNGRNEVVLGTYGKVIVIIMCNKDYCLQHFGSAWSWLHNTHRGAATGWDHGRSGS